MPKTGRKHRNEVILAVAQRVVAKQNPGCYIPPGNAAVERVCSLLEKWLRKRGFNPNWFEFPQENKTQKGIEVIFETKADREVISTSLRPTAAS